MDADDFGKEFGNKFTLKTELPAALKNKENALDSIRAVLNLVRSRVKFNDRNTMWVEDDSRALRDGVGSSAEINCILLNALKNAGFTAYPVAISLRSRGRIPLTHPSVNCFNYFIVSVHHGGKIYYLDGTKPYTDINVIPVDCLVDRAMIIYNPTFDWIDLTAVGNNLNRINMLLGFDSVGVLTGQIREMYQGEMAYQFKSNYNNSENEEKYIETAESRKTIEISDYQLDEKTALAYGFSETYNFRKEDIRTGDKLLSFHPLLFLAMKTNQFKAENRKYPVEFSFPYEQRIDVTISIPDGYDVDELPKSEKLIMSEEKNPVELSYAIQQAENKIQLVYRLKLNTCIVLFSDYAKLRDFWAKIYNKENEMIVLKKI